MANVGTDSHATHEHITANGQAIFSSSQNCKCRRCESQLITDAIKKLYIIQKKEEVSVIKNGKRFFRKMEKKEEEVMRRWARNQKR